MLSGMIRGGWTITGSWPIATEMASRLRALAELKLKIDDLEADPTLSNLIKEYFWFFRDFAFKEEANSLVHNRYFL